MNLCLLQGHANSLLRTATRLAPMLLDRLLAQHLAGRHKPRHASQANNATKGEGK